MIISYGLCTYTTLTQTIIICTSASHNDTIHTIDHGHVSNDSYSLCNQLYDTITSLLQLQYILSLDPSSSMIHNVNIRFIHQWKGLLLSWLQKLYHTLTTTIINVF